MGWEWLHSCKITTVYTVHRGHSYYLHVLHVLYMYYMYSTCTTCTLHVLHVLYMYFSSFGSPDHVSDSLSLYVQDKMLNPDPNQRPTATQVAAQHWMRYMYSIYCVSRCCIGDFFRVFNFHDCLSLQYYFTYN